MKEEIVKLQENNGILLGQLKGLKNDNDNLTDDVEKLAGDNTNLKGKIDDLSKTVEHLQHSEEKIRKLVETLTAKIEAGTDSELKEQIGSLEKLQSETQKEIENLISRMSVLESGLKQAPISGIFSYIENNEYQDIFIQKVEAALSQGLTYAQIDQFLSDNLPKELDDIIKAHPSLTKNYIRNLRRE